MERTVTLLKRINSTSHNAYEDNEGYYWPKGQQFKLLGKDKQKRMKKYYANNRTYLTQVGGEGITISIPDNELETLFGIIL